MRYERYSQCRKFLHDELDRLIDGPETTLVPGPRCPLRSGPTCQVCPMRGLRVEETTGQAYESCLARLSANTFPPQRRAYWKQIDQDEGRGLASKEEAP